MRYAHITSLGCPKNLVDTEFAAGGMLTNGIGFADDPEQADVHFINTCAFIPPARNEAEKFIREAVEWKKRRKGRKIIVGGCLTQWDKDEVCRKRHPEVDLWIPVDEARHLHHHINSLFDDTCACGDAQPKVTTPKWLQCDDTPRLQLTPAHFAYLKIADGCDNHCAYCAIPAIRGRLRNRPLPSIVKEAGNLVANGVEELIVSAQDTTAYRDPDSGASLAELLKAIDAINGDFAVRLLYAHPAGVDDALIDCFATLHHLMRYIDMPIQHASDAILKKMNRGVTAGEISAKISELRSAAPEIAIRTTVMLGFPGETKEDFRELRDFIADIGFARLGAFTYFCEETAPSANFTNSVPAEIAEAREEEIMRLQARISLELNESLVGKELDVIIDQIDGDEAAGRTYMDAPDIDNIVLVKNIGGKLAPGDSITMRVTAAEKYQLYAEPATADF